MDAWAVRAQASTAFRVVFSPSPFPFFLPLRDVDSFSCWRDVVSCLFGAASPGASIARAWFFHV